MIISASNSCISIDRLIIDTRLDFTNDTLKDRLAFNFLVTNVKFLTKNKQTIEYVLFVFVMILTTKSLKTPINKKQCLSQVTTLQRLCIMEGIDEWKVDNYLKNEENTQPVTPSKRKFKFKFDDSGVQSHNRSSRCSMPSLDFHGVRLPSSVHVSRSRISLPAVANSIKNTLSKTLPSRRASMAAIELFGTKVSNGDVRKKKVASEDLGTMEEEDIDDIENRDSALSSRATSESGDVFSRLSVSDSIGSDRIFTDIVGISSNKSGGVRRDSVQTVGEKDERDKLAKIKEEAKRRHSESTIDKRRVSLTGLTEGVSCTIQSGKTYTKPQTETTSYIDDSPVDFHSVDLVKDKDTKNKETGEEQEVQNAPKELNSDIVIDTNQEEQSGDKNEISPANDTCKNTNEITLNANRHNVEPDTSETAIEDLNESKQEANTVGNEQTSNINKDDANDDSKTHVNGVRKSDANNTSNVKTNTPNKPEEININNQEDSADDSVIVQIDKAIQKPNTDAAMVSDSVTLDVEVGKVQLSDTNTTIRGKTGGTGGAPDSVIDIDDV